YLRYPDLKKKQMETLRKFAYYAEHEAIDKLSKEEIISSVIADAERKDITEELVKLTEEHNG
ncbi:MAG: sodium:proton antiporter, partial [Mesobacillus sp.]